MNWVNFILAIESGKYITLNGQICARHKLNFFRLVLFLDHQRKIILNITMLHQVVTAFLDM